VTTAAALTSLATGAATSVAHTYTYLFCDLRTDELLAELPLSGVQYGASLSGLGVLRGHIPYAAETLPLDPDMASRPGRTALYVERDGVIVWGGIVWTRTPVQGGKDIQASEFPSYFQRRIINRTLSTDTSMILDTEYAPAGQRLYTDQAHIVWSLIAYSATGWGGDIRLDTNPLVVGTGVQRQVTYPAWERPQILHSIQQLGAAQDGFDFGIEVGWTRPANNEPPRRYRRARIWYPRRGRSYSESGLTFTAGGTAGNVVEWDWPEDGTALATSVVGLGEGEGEARLAEQAQAVDLLAAGWPLLEVATEFSGVLDTTQLASLTAAELTARSTSQVQPSFTVEADADPAFGSYSVGDEALFVIEPCMRMPAGRESVLRITSIQNSAARGPERVRLECAVA
jgi:hypothetical protein